MSFLTELLRQLQYAAYQWRRVIYGFGIAFFLLAAAGFYYGPWIVAVKSFFYGVIHMCLYYKSLEWRAKP